MKAEIITIGDEILIGQIIDSNSAFIGRELTKIGVDVSQIKTVHDQPKDILNALRSGSERAELILVTGGLGPTKDDKTKAVFCGFFGDRLMVNDKALAHVKELLGRIGEPMLKSNERQARIPSKAQALFNRFGTAPGMWFDEDGVVYVVMPGVPYEMKALMTDEVLPRLVKRFKRPYILQRTVLTYGVGESRIADRLEAWEEALPEAISLAYLPSPGRVRLRLTAKGQNKTLLQERLTSELEELEALIGDIMGGYDGETSLQKRIAEKLTNDQKTLAIAESCTGGKIAVLFTEMPGASAYFKGGIVPYDTRMKTAILGVPEQIIAEHSVVSAAVAREMAIKTKEKFETDFALATTGNAGPEKGDSDAEIGTVYIALASADRAVVKGFRFGDSREKTVQKAIVKALEMLRDKVFD